MFSSTTLIKWFLSIAVAFIAHKVIFCVSVHTSVTLSKSNSFTIAWKGCVLDVKRLSNRVDAFNDKALWPFRVIVTFELAACHRCLLWKRLVVGGFSMVLTCVQHGSQGKCLCATYFCSFLFRELFNYFYWYSVITYKDRSNINEDLIFYLEMHV